MQSVEPTNKIGFFKKKIKKKVREENRDLIAEIDGVLCLGEKVTNP